MSLILELPDIMRTDAVRAVFDALETRGGQGCVRFVGGCVRNVVMGRAPTDLDALMKDRFLIGGPDQVVRALRPFVTEYGMTHLICRVFFPGMPHRHIMRELELIAKEVRPAFA